MSSPVPCEECDKSIGWCTSCNSKRFEVYFPTWTSGNDRIDNFLRGTQTSAKCPDTVFEWVEYLKFTHLQDIEDSKNKKGFWKDGYLLGWNKEKNEWNRKGGTWVKLVTHYCEKYLSSEFLKSEHDHAKKNPSNRLIYGLTRFPESTDFAVIEKLEERCSLCNREWMSLRWCRGCYTDHFESEFNNWTSGNRNIDEFIRDTQRTAEFPQQILEWIPESDLEEFSKIGRGGYGTVFKARWKSGRIIKRNFEKNEWERTGSTWVALKNIEEEGEDAIKFLKEARNMSNCLKTDLFFLDFYGISRHPATGKYLIVMRYVTYGDLRQYLKSNVDNSWENRIDKLWGIAIDLRTLHYSNLVHRDLHSGNVLFGLDRRSFIADFGLARRDGQTEKKEEIKGVLPYIAPEVFNKKPYTKSSDVYSFGVIMWEFTSYESPFCDRAHDPDLILEILNGLRPDVVTEGVPDCYIKLMKQCWDSNPDNRPTAQDLAEIFDKWHQILSGQSTEDDDTRKQFELAEKVRRENPCKIKPYSSKTHEKAYYTSRVIQTIRSPTVPIPTASVLTLDSLAICEGSFDNDE